MRSCHKEQPFLLFNGNVFAELGRRLMDVLFAEVAPSRRREISSAVAHHIAGVLDKEPMVQIVEGMAERFSFAVGDWVRTSRGSVEGKVLKVDGNVIEYRTREGIVFRSAADTLMKMPATPPK